MQRTIVAPVDLADTALDELKEWLAITTPREDAALVALLQASLETCEAFIRQAPIETEFEETLPRLNDWQALSTQPVRAITAVAAIGDDGARAALPVESYLIDLSFHGMGRIRIIGQVAQKRLAVRFTAGIAADWDSLPAALRHGIIRLAAHNFRQRENSEDNNPPAAITALWQPWRRMRLA